MQADSSNVRDEAPSRFLPLAHGILYVVTGFWPVVNVRTFEAVTGPKHDDWLVKASGALIGVIGTVITLAGLRRRCSPEIVLLAAGSAASLATVDVVYVKRRVILPIYLADAMVEILLGAWWLAWAFSRGR